MGNELFYSKSGAKRVIGLCRWLKTNSSPKPTLCILNWMVIIMMIRMVVVIIMMIIMIIKRMARWQEHPSNEKDAVNIVQKSLLWIVLGKMGMLLVSYARTYYVFVFWCWVGLWLKCEAQTHSRMYKDIFDICSKNISCLKSLLFFVMWWWQAHGRCVQH